MEKKKLITPKTLKGFRDFLPPSMIQKEKMIEKIKEVYKLYGFVPIDTPALEYSEILLGKGGDETDKQMYRFKDNGGRDVSMRFDLTVPFARYTAQHYNELDFPFKRYHIANVWRGENTQAGRYREFTQCDFDIIGTTSILSDIEIIGIIYNCMKSLGIDNFTIHINDRNIINGILDKIFISNDKVNFQTEILRILDKINKVGEEEILKLLKNDIKLNSEQIMEIMDFIKIKGTNQEILNILKENYYKDNSQEEYYIKIKNSIDNLEKTLDGLSAMNIPDANYIIDLSITRGLDYYTGIVMETILNDIPEMGSICSGGRYDNLAGLYTKNKLPGVGASIGLDRLMASLEALNIIDKTSTTADVIILNFDSKLNNYYLNLANKLRNKGIKTEIYTEYKKIAKQFSFADKKGFKIAIIVGEKEIEDNVINFRIIETGERIDNLKEDEAITKIMEMINK